MKIIKKCFSFHYFLMQADSQKEDEEEKLDDDCTNGLNNY
jgi:hypothetical protein